jgi:hypothetical protein
MLHTASHASHDPGLTWSLGLYMSDYAYNFHQHPFAWTQDSTASHDLGLSAQLLNQLPTASY